MQILFPKTVYPRDGSLEKGGHLFVFWSLLLKIAVIGGRAHGRAY